MRHMVPSSETITRRFTILRQTDSSICEQLVVSRTGAPVGLHLKLLGSGLEKPAATADLVEK